MWRRVLIWVAVVPGVVWTLMRLLGWDDWFPATQAMAFTQYAALGALVCVPVIAWTKRWGATAVAAVTAAVLTLGIAPRFFADGDAQAGATGPGLRVATANLLAGAGDPGEIVRLVRDQHIQLLAVQEMTPEWLERADAAGLGDLLPHRVTGPQGGASGSGLFSVFELRDGGSHLVTRGWFQQAFAQLIVPGAPAIAIESVHANSPYDADVTGGWAPALRGQAPAMPQGQPRVLLGDFNATLDHAPLRRLVDTGYRDAASVTGDGLVGTWPYDGKPVPPVTIDHVLADGRIGVTSVRIFGIPGSDHRMVLAELRLPAA